MLEPHNLLIIALTLGFASFVQGYSGFGIGIISMSVFSFMPLDLERMSAVLSILCTVIILILFFLSVRHSKIAWKPGLFLCLGIIIGSPLGYFFLLSYKEQPVFKIIFGTIIMYWALSSFFSLSIKKHLRYLLGVPFGVLSGFISGMMVSGGPPIIYYLYSRVHDPRDMKATVQAVFLFVGIVRLTVIGFGGRGFTPELFKVSSIVLPVGIGTLALGHYLSRRATVETFKKIVFALLFLFGTVIAVKGIKGIL